MTEPEFEKIYELYFSSVYRYMLKLSRNKHIAEEITSETFFKAIKAIDKFEGKCNINSWLCQIAKNAYFTYLKKNKRFVEYNTLTEVEDTSTDIEEQLATSEISMEIFKALHKIEEPYKEVFTLRVLGELSFKQIAEIYFKTENWACVTYHRAKNKIQAIMEEMK